MDEDNLSVKFSALNEDFNCVGIDPLVHIVLPTSASKVGTPSKRAVSGTLDQFSKRTVADRHRLVQAFLCK